MRKQLRQRDPIRAYERKTNSALAFGPDARCACGESRPEALIQGSDPTICAACDRKRSGKSPRDGHHPAGENNDPLTIPVPVNDHRAELNVAQYDWPKPVLENPHNSPLLASAAAILGFADTGVYLINNLLLPKANDLISLDEFLLHRLGPGWCADFEDFRLTLKTPNASP